jgi:hypothetical protein
MNISQSIEIKNRRREDRFALKKPGLVRVQFTLEKGTKEEKVYDLNVLNFSKHGLGLLVTEKDFDLLLILKNGQKLHKMRLYTSKASIEADGTVVHKTKIWEGKYNGSYIIGIAGEDFITGACIHAKIPDMRT